VRTEEKKAQFFAEKNENSLRSLDRHCEARSNLTALFTQPSFDLTSPSERPGEAPTRPRMFRGCHGTAFITPVLPLYRTHITPPSPSERAGVRPSSLPHSSANVSRMPWHSVYNARPSLIPHSHYTSRSFGEGRGEAPSSLSPTRPRMFPLLVRECFADATAQRL